MSTETAVKAAESLADWSKWVVTLQTAAIAAVPYILGTGEDKKIAWQNFDYSLKVGLCFYLVSILAGTIVLGNVPIALTKDLAKNNFPKSVIFRDYSTPHCPDQFIKKLR